MTARAIACEVDTLFSLPEVVFKLGQLLNSPYATNGEIGEVLIHDPALTVRVLQAANRRRGGSSPTIETVSGAVARMGREALQEMVVASSVTHRFGDIPPDWIDMERFWLNSIACGVIARSLAFRCRVLSKDQSRLCQSSHNSGGPQAPVQEPRPHPACGIAAPTECPNPCGGHPHSLHVPLTKHCECRSGLGQ